MCDSPFPSFPLFFAHKRTLLHRPFILLVFTVIFLLLLIVGSIALLYTVGNVPLPSVLAGGTVGPIKRD